jgi:hypothetical protein
MILERLKLGGRPRIREKSKGMEVECSFRTRGSEFEETNKLKAVIPKFDDGNTRFYFWQ